MELLPTDQLLHYISKLNYAQELLETCRQRQERMLLLIQDGWFGSSADAMQEKVLQSVGQLQQTSRNLEQVQQLLQMALCTQL